MKTGLRILAVMVSLVTLVTGPLAPLASAQQPTPTPPPPPVTTTPPPPPVTTQMPPITEVPPQRYDESQSAAYDVGAGIANIFYVPGKGFLCFLGGAVGVFVMIVSAGSQPKTAAYFAREGCGGKWLLTGDDIRPDPDTRSFDWEKNGR
jgi:hypothetical protein